MLQATLLVAAGGAVGAALRYLSVAGSVMLFGLAFPWGTLFVNVAGSLVMGIAAAYIRQETDFSPAFQAFVMPGLLGGFTTFSAFSLDIVTLFERDQAVAALLYIGVSVCGGIAALLIGFWVYRSLLT